MTEFGNVIPFVPDYFNRNSQYARYWSSDAATEATKETPPRFVVRDWVNFSALVTFLKRSNLLNSRRTLLDIGGGNGSAARLFVAAGIVEEARTVDLIDFGDVRSGDIRVDQKLGGWLNGPASHTDEDVLEPFLAAKLKADHYPEKPGPGGLFQSFPRKPILREMIIKDIYETSGCFDFLTAINFMEYHDLDRILPKIRGLLERGGLFVAQAACWWFPVNLTDVVGHFPYACQRLSFDDLLRYYTVHHPELLSLLWKRYNLFHEGKQHPTLTGWFDLARKHDLKPLAFESVMPRHRVIGVKDAPPQLFAKEYFNHTDVLRDIHHLHSGVTVESLFTSQFRLAFTTA